MVFEQYRSNSSCRGYSDKRGLKSFLMSDSL
ncbi:hypothetical protein Leryth_024922 [Lithospermum erythrorhizon]|nr:hypothetical protein Leryth_024922 [Lithospermum erythrorhizon]